MSWDAYSALCPDSLLINIIIGKRLGWPASSFAPCPCQKKRKPMPVGMFGRPRIDPFLLPTMVGSRQVACLWGFKWLHAVAGAFVGLGLLYLPMSYFCQYLGDYCYTSQFTVCCYVASMSKMTLEQRRHALVTLLEQWQAFKENRRDRSPGEACSCTLAVPVQTTSFLEEEPSS